ncbi:hypothetical protein Cni_G27093 [Canna indica]|uniref:B box-type domain-containing protein n=1 Tax=Canna indica TaxID=4628 RepID=A0AAQ3QNZ0_9LILI|nr:hypothetical protein Cni_G27093 [Canna indica]
MEKNDTFSRLLFEALELEQLPACELCGREAVLVCTPDAAFLCWACDATVHSANFLAARHVRWLACGGCHRLDSARRVSGARPEPVRSLCSSCHPAQSPSSSSSSCVSTSQSTATGEDQEEKKPAAAKRRHVDVDEMAEGILLDSSELRGVEAAGGAWERQRRRLSHASG